MSSSSNLKQSELTHPKLIAHPLALSDREEEVLYFNGDSYFRDLGTALNSATHRVDLEFYIFNLDPLGLRILDLLVHAANGGVDVRVLIDAFGSPAWTQDDIKIHSARGVQVRVYNAIKLDSFLSTLQKLNKRNHRKTCIIDGRIAYLGSMNMSAVHLTEFHGEKAWRDTGVRIFGPAVAILQMSFEQAWNPHKSSMYYWLLWKMRKLLPNILQINSTSFLRLKYHQTLIQKIKTARGRIWITNAYFVPDARVTSALKHSDEKNHVDVRILIPRKSDILFMTWVGHIFYRSLLNSGVRIFEYLPSVLHAKTLIVDDWAIVGTSNFDRRSFFHDLEADVVLNSLQAKSALADQFELDLKSSQEIFISDIGRFWLQNIFGIFFIFRYWL